MAASVLGKRTRGSALDADAASPRNTRAKRRAQFVVLDNNENENPFITPKKNHVACDEEKMEVDELVEHVKPSKRTRTAGTVPAKYGAMEDRVALSPSKVNGHSKTSKAAATDVKPINPSTPSTPRHRDALASKVAVTPRHRFIVPGKPLTPRTPRTPTTPRAAAPTVYNEARQLFTRGNNPGKLVGRDNERKELDEFVSKRISKKSSGCIYVSGPPGTGKSALVNEVITGTQGSESIKTAYINCMSVKNANDVFGKLLLQFRGIMEEDDDCETEMADLKGIFHERDTSYLVTLDEIDHLLDLDLELLYNLFEWSLQRSSSLILVGIANALDFTDRFLPRLKSRGLKPHLLPFMPYNASQVASVIKSKLRSLLPSSATVTAEFTPFLHPTAILFLSKKVSSQTGDLRKAFDICRRAIDLVEADTRDQHMKKVSELTPLPTPSPSKTPLVENINLSSPPVRSPSKAKSLNSTLASPLAQLTVETAPRATIAHMAKITAAVFSHGASTRLANLNLQQKAVLCALAALEKNLRAAISAAIAEQPQTPSKHARENASPTVKQLFETYTALCKREDVLHPLTGIEFGDIVGSLETLSLISVVDGKNGSFAIAAAGTPSKRGRGTGGFGGKKAEERRVASCVSVKELEVSLNGAGSGILRGILEGGL